MVAFFVELLFSSVVYASDACKVYEYAELKDMPKSTLVMKYCLYTAFRKIEHQAFEDGLAKAAGDRAVGLDYSAVTDDHRRQSEQCGDESVRIARVLETKYHINQKIDCDIEGQSKAAAAPKSKSSNN
jgi:hypothetical protein